MAKEIDWTNVLEPEKPSLEDLLELFEEQPDSLYELFKQLDSLGTAMHILKEKALRAEMGFPSGQDQIIMPGVLPSSRFGQLLEWLHDIRSGKEQYKMQKMGLPNYRFDIDTQITALKGKREALIPEIKERYHKLPEWKKTQKDPYRYHDRDPFDLMYPVSIKEMMGEEGRGVLFPEPIIPEQQPEDFIGKIWKALWDWRLKGQSQFVDEKSSFDYLWEKLQERLQLRGEWEY